MTMADYKAARAAGCNESHSGLSADDEPVLLDYDAE